MIDSDQFSDIHFGGLSVFTKLIVLVDLSATKIRQAKGNRVCRSLLCLVTWLGCQLGTKTVAKWSDENAKAQDLIFYFGFD
jgi:hypothetical protein